MVATSTPRAYSVVASRAVASVGARAMHHPRTDACRAPGIVDDHVERSARRAGVAGRGGSGRRMDRVELRAGADRVGGDPRVRVVTEDEERPRSALQDPRGPDVGRANSGAGD